GLHAARHRRRRRVLAAELAAARRDVPGARVLNTMDRVATLLLTDLVDSAALSQQIGDSAMAGVWAAHDRVARDLLRRWQGRELSMTDGLLLLSEQPAQAVGYVLDYHRALAALALRQAGLRLQARAGLHTARVTLRENLAEDVALGAKPIEVDGVSK